MDSFHLQRFLQAQDPQWAAILAELKAGQKRSHWMWFVFPQINGLGMSENASYYGIASRSEAEAYLAHPVLGQRLLECTAMVNAVQGRSAEQIFGGIDAMKFRSSTTLFAEVSGPDSVFASALDKYFGGQPDQRTLQLLSHLG